MAALPYFDEIDPSTIDVLLVTQYVLLESENSGQRRRHLCFRCNYCCIYVCMFVCLYGK